MIGIRCLLIQLIEHVHRELTNQNAMSALKSIHSLIEEVYPIGLYAPLKESSRVLHEPISIIEINDS